MKRFISFVSILIVLCSLVACTATDATQTIEKPTHAEASQRIGNFIIIESDYSKIQFEDYNEEDNWTIQITNYFVTHIVYDEETKVMYTIILSSRADGGKTITPLYNPDGTLRVYSPEE